MPGLHGLNMLNSLLRTHFPNSPNKRISKLFFVDAFYDCSLIPSPFINIAGSGKTSLLNSLIRACNEDKWFVITIKYDKQAAPITAASKALDDFFAKWFPDDSSQYDLDPAVPESFRKVCHCISTTIDKEGMGQLLSLIPNMRKAFPQILAVPKPHNQGQGSSSIDKVGSAKSRLKYLFHVLMKCLFSLGRPTLIAADDMQWDRSAEGLKHLITNYFNIPCDMKAARRQGIVIAGTFRSNEVSENDGIMKTIHSFERSESVKVTRINIGELGLGDITKLISAKLCLPMRRTGQLAGLIQSKTGGNPFFVVQFLKSVIEDRMLEFSPGQGWTWDCGVIDAEMVSNGAAGLLTTRLNQLPAAMRGSMKVASCLGSQVEGSTMDLLSLHHRNSLYLAINEGFIRKTGPLYKFNHDFIRQSSYDLIPVENRSRLHRCIGTRLLQNAANDPPLHLLAVDQINISCKNAILDPEERSSFARANVAAAKFAISSSTFEKARSYITAGIQLLDTNHWETQYDLSLELFELSASVSCMQGNVGNMESCLNEIIANVRSFEDSLTPISLLAKLMASASRYDEAMANCLTVLSNLGEEVSIDASLPIVVNELAVIQTTLANITLEQVQQLPQMREESKLHAMKFLSMLCSYSRISKPMMLPILSGRMVRLTIEEGFCDESIIGLATAGYGVFIFSDDVRLAYRIVKVCDSLIEESPNRHALRSRLCRELDCSSKAIVEPQHSVMPLLRDNYNSAMLAGDAESAISCLLAYCTSCFYCGANLVSLSKIFLSCIAQSEKYQQTNHRYVAMSNFRCCIYLTGRSNDEVGIKTYQELEEIGESTNSNILLWRVFICRMGDQFYDRNWIRVMELSEKLPPTTFNRIILRAGRAWYEGVASLNLARQTHNPKWRRIGEEAVKKLSNYKRISKWNYENKSKLLQAELHYLNGNIETAEVEYKASILSAQEHKFINDEALAMELYGIFCIENGMSDKGTAQLHGSLDKYKQWGAIKKAKELQLFVDQVDSASLR